MIGGIAAWSQKPQTSLPTPPIQQADLYKPDGQYPSSSVNLASVAIQHPVMGSALDAPHNHASSLTARRSAALNLPNFELPPPPHANYQKYPNYSGAPSAAGVGNLLTPPPNTSGETLGSISAGMSSQSGSTSTPGMAAQYNNGYWTAPSSYGYNSQQQQHQQQQQQQQQQNQWNQSSASSYQSRNSMFSPMAPLVRNNTNSPATSESIPPPSYEMNQQQSLPSFQSSMSSSTPNSLSSNNLQHQQSQLMMLNATQPQPSPNTVPTSNIYGNQPTVSTPQQAHFSSSYGTQHSPMGAQSNSRISPLSANPQSQHQHYSRPYPSYSLPAMPGAVMSNIHSPNHQMSMVGGMSNGMMSGFNSGHAASMQHMYSHHGPGSNNLPNDRPFRCDQCPQSFNRNHDLKRHKRIHLAVKPFPCKHCDKSFSRKDALKVRDFP